MPCICVQTVIVPRSLSPLSVCACVCVFVNHLYVYLKLWAHSINMLIVHSYIIYTEPHTKWISQRGLMYVHVFIRVKYTNYTLFRSVFFRRYYYFFLPFNCAWCMHDRMCLLDHRHTAHLHIWHTQCEHKNRAKCKWWIYAPLCMENQLKWFSLIIESDIVLPHILVQCFTRNYVVLLSRSL